MNIMRYNSGITLTVGAGQWGEKRHKRTRNASEPSQTGNVPCDGSNAFLVRFIFSKWHIQHSAFLSFDARALFWGSDGLKIRATPEFCLKSSKNQLTWN
jgi:hypothetical protein